MSNTFKSECRVSIVTVTYNSLSILPELLNSLPERVPCIVVDNASDNHAALSELVVAYGARLIRNDNNCGFGVACNIGAAQAQTEFLLFLNPDARLERDTLKELVSCADVSRLRGHAERRLVATWQEEGALPHECPGRVL